MKVPDTPIGLCHRSAFWFLGAGHPASDRMGATDLLDSEKLTGGAGTRRVHGNTDNRRQIRRLPPTRCHSTSRFSRTAALSSAAPRSTSATKSAPAAVVGNRRNVSGFCPPVRVQTLLPRPRLRRPWLPLSEGQGAAVAAAPRQRCSSPRRIRMPTTVRPVTDAPTMVSVTVRTAVLEAHARLPQGWGSNP